MDLSSLLRRGFNIIILPLVNRDAYHKTEQPGFINKNLGRAIRQSGYYAAPALSTHQYVPHL